MFRFVWSGPDTFFRCLFRANPYRARGGKGTHRQRLQEKLQCFRGKKICFIGTGNMGEALVSGLVSNATRPEDIICTDVRESTLTLIAEKYQVRTTTDNKAAIQSSEIVIFSVKPQILALVLKGDRRVPGHEQADYFHCSRRAPRCD